MHSRAGLVALVLTIIFSFVSAVPLPVIESGLSSALPLLPPSLNGKPEDHNLLDTPRISEISSSGRMTIPLHATSVLTRRYISTDMDDEQLVRRSIFDKIKDAFQSFGHKVKEGFQNFGHKVKEGFQKAGGAIKSGFQKAGEGIKKGFQKVKEGFQKAGGAIKKGFQKVGEGIKTAAKTVGKGIVTAAKTVGKGIVTAAKTVGKGVVTAAKKVGNFMKTTGATVAKFGLKVVQSTGEVLGHVASFIPGIGKPIQAAIHGVSAVAGIASDHIHANLSPQLQKGMNVMDKADKIMDYIPRRRDLLEEEVSFQ